VDWAAAARFDPPDVGAIRRQQAAPGATQGQKARGDPVGAPLKATLDSRRPEKPAGPILRNTFGEPWTSDGFRTTFKRAGLGEDDLHFHDLRGTAVTRLALSGCTTAEIAAIIGHSPRDVEAILEAHYLGGRVELAEQAMMKLDARYGNGT
jgi:integrase